MFDALASLPDATAEAFQQALFSMSWADPCHRKLLELEGLKEWVAPRERGYESLRAALDQDGGW
jgi:phosphonate transport system substrate-binding protein